MKVRGKERKGERQRRSQLICFVFCRRRPPQYTLGLYIASTLLVLLSPVFFILVDYVSCSIARIGFGSEQDSPQLAFPFSFALLQMLFSRLVAAMEMERHLFM